MPRQNKLLEAIKSHPVKRGEWISIIEFAKKLGVSKSVLYWNIRVGNIPHNRVKQDWVKHKEYFIKI